MLLFIASFSINSVSDSINSTGVRVTHAVSGIDELPVEILW